MNLKSRKNWFYCLLLPSTNVGDVHLSSMCVYIDASPCGQIFSYSSCLTHLRHGACKTNTRKRLQHSRSGVFSCNTDNYDACRSLAYYMIQVWNINRKHNTEVFTCVSYFLILRTSLECTLLSQVCCFNVWNRNYLCFWWQCQIILTFMTLKSIDAIKCWDEIEFWVPKKKRKATKVNAFPMAIGAAICWLHQELFQSLGKYTRHRTPKYTIARSSSSLDLVCEWFRDSTLNVNEFIIEKASAIAVNNLIQASTFI